MSIATVARPKIAGRSGLALAVMIALFMGIIGALMGGSPAFANEDESAAREKLITSVTSQIADEQYRMEGGGYITGSQLVTDKGDIIQENYDKLDSKGRDRLVSDIVEKSDSIVAEDNASTSDPSATTVTTATQSNWLKELQNTPGFGSKLLTQALSNTKPDMVTAQQFWMPFSGPFSTLLGILTFLIFMGFALTVILDLCYIVIPMFRMFVGDDKDGDKKISKVISGAAKRAVEEEEGGSDGGKSALGYYLKKSAMKMIVLGVCLVYLISGQLWVAVGMILDLVRGWIGF